MQVFLLTDSDYSERSESHRPSMLVANLHLELFRVSIYYLLIASNVKAISENDS